MNNGRGGHRISHGPRQTRQRVCLLKVIEEADGPLEIPEILRRAQRELPTLGLATVYRTLRLLEESKQIRPVNLPDGSIRYEIAGLGPHHFKCRSCHRVYTLPEEILPLPRKTFLALGFVIEAQESVFYGWCPKCTAEKPNWPLRKSPPVQ
jgi:Fur family ferric uptake transcriptional regulator